MIEKIKVFLSKFFFWLFVVISSLVLLAPIVPYHWVWFMGILAIGLPFFSVVQAIFALRFVIKKQYFDFLIMLLLIACSYLYWTRMAVRNTVVENNTDQAIKVFSGNIAFYDHSFNVENNRTNRLKELLAALGPHSPDILILQEYFGFREMGAKEILDKKLFKEAGYNYVVTLPDRMTGNKKREFVGGVLIASKNIPLKKVYEKKFVRTINRILGVEAKVKNKKWVILNAHLHSFLAFSKKERDTTISMFKTLEYDFIERSNQIRVVADSLIPSYSSLWFAGDMNDPMTGNSYTYFSRKLKNAFTESGSGYGATWPGFFPLFMIDHFYYSKDWEALKTEVISIPKSDHKGLLVTIQPGVATANTSQENGDSSTDQH